MTRFGGTHLLSWYFGGRGRQIFVRLRARRPCHKNKNICVPGCWVPEGARSPEAGIIGVFEQLIVGARKLIFILFTVLAILKPSTSPDSEKSLLYDETQHF